MTILEGEEGTSSDCAKSVMVKSPESLYALLKFQCISDDKYYSTVTMSQDKEIAVQDQLQEIKKGYIT